MDNSYRHNFLRQVILKIDFSNIFEKDAEDFSCTTLRGICESIGLNNVGSGFDNKASIKINNSQDTNETPVIDELEKTKTWTFKKRSKDSDIEIKICKNYLYLLIDVNNKYDSVRNYLASITKIMKELCTKYKNIDINRIGIRKINSCLIRTTTNINEYLKKTAIDYEKVLDISNNSKIQAISEVSLLFKNNAYVNFARNIQFGKTSNDEELYQVIIDIDSFINDYEYLSKNIDDIETLIIGLNKTLFYVFDNCLTEKFKNCLKKERFDDNNIIGVNYED